MIHGVSTAAIYESFKDVTNWINETLSMPLVKVLMEEDEAFFQKLSQ